MKLAIVTGASKGLGRALIDILIKKDFLTIGCGRSFCQLPKEAIYFQTDLSLVPEFIKDFDNIWSLVEGKRFKEIILINNAALLRPIGRLENCNALELTKQLKVNTIAPLLINQWLLQKTQNFSGRAVSISVSSGAAVNPCPESSGYCMSKAAVPMMSRCLAEEEKNTIYKQRRFEIWDFSPGTMDTEMQELIRTEGNKNYEHIKKCVDLKSKENLKNPVLVAQRLVALLEKPQENATIQE